MALTKNLANCTPREFLKQVNLVRKSAETWFEATKVMEIRKDVPKMNPPKNASPEKTQEYMEKYRKELGEAARKNLSRMLDSILEEHPDETLELLALCCFVEPKDVDEHPIREYLANVSEMMNDEAVLSFFTSFMRLGQSGFSA